MARPTTTADLPEDARRRRIASVDFQNLGTRPELAAAFAELMRTVRKAGAELVQEYQSTVVYSPATDQELADALRSAQSSWDEGERRYNEFVNGTREFKDYEVRMVVAFANEEGFTDARTRRQEVIDERAAAESSEVRARLAEIRERVVEPSARVIKDQPQA